MKERRQSWTAPWWSLWKTSGCSSSRIASTLLKKVKWFCCLNSRRFKWIRLCKRPAIIGRCLERGKEWQTGFRPLTRKKTVSGVNEITNRIIFTWAKGQGETQPAYDKLGWRLMHDFQQTLNLLYQPAVWPDDVPGHQAEENTQRHDHTCYNNCKIIEK